MWDNGASGCAVGTSLIAGTEQVTSGRKSVERYPQTWLCAHERIAPIEWAARPPSPEAQNSTGFDPADDDIRVLRISPLGARDRAPQVRATTIQAGALSELLGPPLEAEQG